VHGTQHAASDDHDPVGHARSLPRQLANRGIVTSS
jgi:hypothetical protein